MTRPIILAYDGSKEATRALRTAGEILRGHAVVAHVYTEQPAAVAPPFGAGLGLPIEPGLTADPLLAQELEEHAREQAARIAREGLELARAAGFEAEAELVVGDGVHGAWNAIVALAEERDASVIVVGHRDRSWIQDT
ncbi:MAG: universal stress protein, partial [Actinobacteria bacterium]|nr:universal stress protein [Actinomycetota bacterium]